MSVVASEIVGNGHHYIRSTCIRSASQQAPHLSTLGHRPYCNSFDAERIHSVWGAPQCSRHGTLSGSQFAGLTVPLPSNLYVSMEKLVKLFKSVKRHIGAACQNKFCLGQTFCLGLVVMGQEIYK